MSSTPTPLPSAQTASLAVTLRMFAEEWRSPFTSRALRSISEALERGATWKEAFESQARWLPPFLRGAFQFAEQGGALGRVLSHFLLVVRRNRRAQRRVLGAILYPALVCSIAFLLFVVLMIWLVPVFRTIFEDFGVSLPGLTLALLAVSDLLVRGWFWLSLGGAVLAGVAAIILFTPSFAVPPPVARGLQWVPIVGTASWLAAASEFCSLLGIAIEGGAPLPEALRLTASAMRDSNLRYGARRLAEAVERGEPPFQAALSLPHFRPAVVQVLRHADRERGFADVLKSHGELFALQAESYSRLAVVWLEPFLMIAIGIVVGMVLISMFMPLVKLLNELS